MNIRLIRAKEKTRSLMRRLVQDPRQEMMGAGIRRAAMKDVRGDRTQDTFGSRAKEY